MYIIYPPKEKNWRHHLITLFALAMLFPLLKMGGLLGAFFPTDPSYSVEQATLDQSFHSETTTILNNGGIIEFAKNYFTGSHSVENVYPLYPALLLTIYQNDLNDFVTNARSLNFILALLFLILFYWTLRRTEGEVFSLFSLLLFLMVPYLFLSANHLGPNLVWLISLYMCWFNLVEETDLEGHGLSSGLWGGALLLISPFGGVLFFGTLGFYLITYKSKVLKEKSLAYFLLGFALISSPLLMRDFWLVKNPFNSFVQFWGSYSESYISLLSHPQTWPILLLGVAGILLDPNKKRRHFSAILLAISIVWGPPLLLFPLLCFFSAGLLHAGLTSLLGKASLWLAILLAAGICGWSWFA